MSVSADPTGPGRRGDALKSLAARAGATLLARRDLALVVLLFAIVFLMIIPLPTVLVDILIAANIALSITLLIIGVYIKDPLDISTLPSVILISVIFRLALSITTTRLILATGDPGQIVQTFGDFVVFGNLVVGLVIFLIITVVQFLVITKGAERVAEVAARFSLDGLPGKQMSIDSDLRAGLISVDEARARRQALEKEMQFYGAMDGAMKFVKGDAIAGLVIIAINLLGGLAIGVWQRGMTTGEALDLYALLTVGDGLVSQIPALMLSITSGAIITRVTTEKSENLGADISLQLFAKPAVLRTAAAVLAIFALIPGLPTFIFLGLAGIMAGGAELARSFERRRAASDGLDPPEASVERTEMDRLAPLPVISLRISPELREKLAGGRLRARLDAFREAYFERMGVWSAPATLRLDHGLAEEGPGARWRIDIDGVRRGDGVVEFTKLVLGAEAQGRLDLAGVPFEERWSETGRRRLIVSPERADDVERAGIEALSGEEQLVDAVADAVHRHADAFVGVQETSVLLQGMERHYGALTKQALTLAPIEKIAQVLQQLVADGVSIRNLRAILNALIEWAPQEGDPTLLAEYVRGHLKAQISQAHVNALGVLPVYLLDEDVLARLREGVTDSSQGSYLALDHPTTRRFVEAVRPLTAENGAAGRPAVLLAPIDLRRLIQHFLRDNDVRLPVLSYQDVAADVRVHCLGSLSF